MNHLDQLLQEAKRIASQEEDEERPYDHKYAAADLLKEELARLESHEHGKEPTLDQDQASTSPSGSTDEHDVALRSKALLQSRIGLILLETDLLAEGQQALESALPWLEQHQDHHLALLLECLNAMGALCSGRAELDDALTWLSKSEAVYSKHRGRWGRAASAHRQQQGDASASAAAAATAAGGSSSAADDSAATSSSSRTWDDVETNFTSTLFYMAQVHGHAMRKSESAIYCAATLQRQLQSKQYKLSEWVQNCLQLAGYYVNYNAFALGEYCLMAASKVADLAQQQAAPAGSSGGGTAPEQQAATAGSSGGGAAPEQQAGPAGSSGGGTAPEQQVLEGDVAANRDLAWAKFYMQRLASSYNVHCEGVELDMLYPNLESFPDILIFEELALPAPDKLAWGAAALTSSFEGARELFNSSMTHFKAALTFYELDGWVTEHCNILMDISNLYRCLAGFEPDMHRRVLMHKQRASRLEPLHGALNPEFFLGLVRSVDLELGNVYREIMELREEEGQGPAKVSAAGREAVRYYRHFLDTFRNPRGPGGELPDRVDADSERYFLLASFSLGRVLHKVDTSGPGAAKWGCGVRDVESLVRSHTHLLWTAEYVRRHKLEQYMREADLAVQLAELVAEKISLSQRLAAVSVGKQ